MNKRVEFMHCFSWFSSNPLLKWWRMPAKWQGWLVVTVLVTASIVPLGYYSLVYKGDTYCQSVISQGIQTDCDPHIATGVYIMGSVSWFIAMLLLLHVVSTQKPTVKKSATITPTPPAVKTPKKPSKKEKRAAK